VKSVGAIVLAAGQGSRFGHAKQFAELRPGVRLVDNALASAREFADQVVLVLPPGHLWEGQSVENVAVGGPTRLASVASGLAAISAENDVIVVHDAAHPLAPPWMFEEVINLVRTGADAAVPFLPVANVVKRMDADFRLVTVGRDGLGLAQMPMAFAAHALRSAHAYLRSLPVPPEEDSTLVELMGGQVVAVKGSVRNHHVVDRMDLALVRVLTDHPAYEQ
jgi:2-C-methyl-D-erythritol 4-phosphate cytidylyltransferase